MNIRILNNDLTQHGIAAGFESVEFVRAFNTKGSFTLVINANNATAKYIKLDKIIYLGTGKTGYIDKVTTQRKTGKADEFIIAEGVELKDRLGRIIYPDSSLEAESYTGEYLETIVKSLINKNAGCLASETRQIPNLVTAADMQRGEVMDYSARYKDLSTEIYSLLAGNEMGLTAEIDFDGTEIVFDVAEGRDLTAEEGQAGGIALSLATKTALEITDTDDRLNCKNLSVTAGPGEGADQEILEVGTTATGYGRREVYTEARDIKSTDELATRGAQKLSETGRTRSVSAKANSLGSYTVGEDYDLGDFVSVDTGEVLYDAQVVKLKHRWAKESPPEIEVCLNFDAEDMLQKDITAKHMDYNALIASGSSQSDRLLAEVVVETQAASVAIYGLDSDACDGVFYVIVKANSGAGTGAGFPQCQINGSSTAFNSARSVVTDTRTSNGAMAAPSGNDWYAYFSQAAPLGVVEEVSDANGMIKAVITQDGSYHTSMIAEFEAIASGHQRIGTYRSEGTLSGKITSLIFYMADEFTVGSVIQVWRA